jgi:hypothetical protein
VGHGAKKQRESGFAAGQGARPKRTDADRRVRQAEHYGRLIRLLELLQGRLAYDAPALARELGVTKRTVYRDLYVLQLAGIPCHYGPGATTS